MRYLSSLLISALLITNVFAFTDLTSSHVNSTAIDYVEAEGIVQGYEDGTYRPDNTINRAEFTKIIVETWIGLTDESTDPSDMDFSDLEDTWYVPYIRSAQANGLIDGYEDGTFKPGEYINFAEASKIIMNGFGDSSSSNTDIWYQPYVESLESYSAIPTSIAGFDHYLTRGEMAEMIYRLDASVEDQASLSYEILEGTPIYTEYTEELYNTLLGNRPFVLYFHADWCPTCVALEEYINDNLDTFSDGTIFLEVDYDSHVALRQEYDIVIQYTFVTIDKAGDAMDTLTTNNVAWVREAINYTLE